MTNLPPSNPPPDPSVPPIPPAPPPANDANQMAMLAHLLGIVGWFIPSLVIWQVKKEVPFVAQEAKEALNFQITIGIAYIAASIIGGMGMCINLFFLTRLPFLIWVVSLVFCLIAGLKTKDGIAYRYPFAIRLIK